jgi:hypothetical protein
MSLVDVLNDAADIILMTSILPLALFIIRYVTHSPFYLTREGVNVLMTKIAMLAILAIGLAGLLLPDYFGRPLVRIMLYSSLVVFFWVDFVQLITIQRKYPYSYRNRGRNGIHEKGRKGERQQDRPEEPPR